MNKTNKQELFVQFNWLVGAENILVVQWFIILHFAPKQ